MTKAGGFNFIIAHADGFNKKGKLMMTPTGL